MPGRGLVVGVALAAAGAAVVWAAQSAPRAPAQAAAQAPARTWDEQTISVPILGKAPAYIPKQPSTHVVIFLSGDGGWNLGVVDMARRIMPKAIVIGASYPALRKASGAGPRCWMPAGDLEEIAHGAEKQLNLPDYYPPVLVGYSSGATLVYAALATAPPTTFAGGLSLGFCPDLPSNRPVCNADAFKPTFDAKKNTAWLPKMASLPREFYVLNGVQDQVCLPPEMHVFLDDMKGAHFVEAPGTGHGFSRPGRWGDLFDQAIDALFAAQSAEGTRRPPPGRTSAELQRQLEALNLPLEYRWAEPGRAAVIFVSGDGGWASIDDNLAAYLTARGVSVVGVSSLRYFWKKKTPEETGADLLRIEGVLAAARLPLFIGGYSFGAEVAPFAIGAWPDAERRKLAGQILVAPGETASFEISPLNWVLRARATPLVVADAVRRAAVPTFCLAGDQEEPRDTACDDLGSAAVTMRLPGSHHFGGRYDAVGKAVLDFIDKTLTPHAYFSRMPR